MTIARLLPLALLLLAGCSKQPDVDALDNSLTGNVVVPLADPALTSALADQIMVDPNLIQQSNGHAVRAPATPLQTQIPLGTEPGDVPGAPKPATTLAGAPQPDGAVRAPGCAESLAYSAAWAAKLPGGLALPADARVAEAAGDDSRGCATRVVSFASTSAPGRLLDLYRDVSRKAGWGAETGRRGGEAIVAGTRGADAFLLTATARADGGSDADLVVRLGD